MFRYFIYLAYDGTNYHGWQIQPNGITVQQSIEEALATLLRQPVPIVRPLKWWEPDVRMPEYMPA